jgi:hypothetical protein
MRYAQSQKSGTLNNLVFACKKTFNKTPGGPSWSWSYSSWIYNYLCNQWLSPLKLWVQTPFMARCTWCNRSVVFSGYSTNKNNHQDITEILLKVASTSTVAIFHDEPCVSEYKNITSSIYHNLLYTITDSCLRICNTRSIFFSIILIVNKKNFDFLSYLKLV